MKDTKQKLILLSLIVLLALCSIFIYQWNKEKNQSIALNSIKERMVFSNFSDLSDGFYGIAETLNDYDNDFTEQEKNLYLSSIDKEIRSLNNIGTDLGYLLHSSDINNTQIYEQQIRVIEEFLTDIKQGNTTNEEDIHLIGQVVKKQNEKLSDMIFEEQIGVEGINTKEEVERIAKIIEAINNEIKKIDSK